MRQGRTVHISQEQSHCNHNFVKKILWFIVFLLPIAMIYIEWEWKAKNDAYLEVRGLTIEVDDGHVSDELTHKLIHLTSTNFKSDKLLYDWDFGIHVPGALKLERVTEYCQWAEHFTEDELDDGSKVRRYYYVKGWQPRPIVSVLFDQPFHHHNPQRDPFPPTTFSADHVTVGKYTATRPLIDRLGGFQNFFYSPENLADFDRSPAIREGFKPIGNGYFYSAYEESGQMLLGRLMGMALEGSFDWQVTELFSSCTAGDIRVYYREVNPRSLSLIGKQLNNAGEIGLYQPITSPHQVGIMYGGTYRAQELYDKDLNDTWYNVMLGRLVICTFWSLLSHLASETPLSWLGFSYFALSLQLSVWLLVRLTNVTLAILFVEQNPLLAITLTGATILLSYKFHKGSHQEQAKRFDRAMPH